MATPLLIDLSCDNVAVEPRINEACEDNRSASEGCKSPVMKYSRSNSSPQTYSYNSSPIKEEDQISENGPAQSTTLVVQSHQAKPSEHVAPQHSLSPSESLDDIVSRCVQVHLEELTKKVKGIEKQVHLLSTENRKLRLDLSNVYSIVGTVEGGSMRRRPKIDRSMIGQPTNFQHTGHIGSTDVGSQLTTVQVQMKTKGGYGDNETSTQPSMT